MWSTELRLARAYRDEAEQIKKAAERDLEAARYERGQAEHRLATVAQMERSISEREQKLKELGEPELVARAKATADKLKQAQQLTTHATSGTLKDRNGNATLTYTYTPTAAH